jgi:hypothetical protein
MAVRETGGRCGLLQIDHLILEEMVNGFLEAFDGLGTNQLKLVVVARTSENKCRDRSDAAIATLLGEVRDMLAAVSTITNFGDFLRVKSALPADFSEHFRAGNICAITEIVLEDSFNNLVLFSFGFRVLDKAVGRNRIRSHVSIGVKSNSHVLASLDKSTEHPLRLITSTSFHEEVSILTACVFGIPLGSIWVTEAENIRNIVD